MAKKTKVPKGQLSLGLPGIDKPSELEQKVVSPPDYILRFLERGRVLGGGGTFEYIPEKRESLINCFDKFGKRGSQDLTRVDEPTKIGPIYDGVLKSYRKKYPDYS